MEDIVATLTQSESKWRTSFDQLFVVVVGNQGYEKAIGSVQSTSAAVMCVVVAVVAVWPIRKVLVRTSLLGATVGQEVGSEKASGICTSLRFESFTGLKSHRVIRNNFFSHISDSAGQTNRTL